MRDKYANKSLPMRIFHRYTGFIVMGIFVAVIASAYYLYTADMYFFEGWSCEQFDYVIKNNFEYSQLTDDEFERFKEIAQECKIVYDFE